MSQDTPKAFYTLKVWPGTDLIHSVRCALCHQVILHKKDCVGSQDYYSRIASHFKAAHQDVLRPLLGKVAGIEGWIA